MGAQCCALFPFFVAAGAVFALMDGIRSLVHQEKTLPQSSATCPALPCRRFEISCLKSRICQALRASPSPIPCAVMAVQGHRREGQEKQAPGRKSRQDSPSQVICREERVGDTSHRGYVLVRGATSKVCFASSGCLG